VRRRFPTTVFRFTLSDFLFQINLKHLKSITLLYFSGTTQALATYVNIGTIKDLIFKIFPKIVRFLFVHKSYKLFIFSILFSQLNFSQSSLSCPKYIPRVLVGLSVHLINLIK
jgi:hypothetical protein